MRKDAFFCLLSLSVFLAWAFQAEARKAADGDAGKKDRLCQEQDLVKGGVWQLLRLQESPPASATRMHEDMPYEYLTFPSFGHFSFSLRSQPPKDAKELQNAFLWTSAPGLNAHYTLDAQGALIFYIDGKPRYQYRCVAILEQEKAFRKGDLILTGYVKKSGGQVTKVFRRWF